MLEASRAVNQAIGRVIRHKDDYGTIILCDNRFTASNTKCLMTSWVQSYITDYEKFGLFVKGVTDFFKQTMKTVRVCG